MLGNLCALVHACRFLASLLSCVSRKLRRQRIPMAAALAVIRAAVIQAAVMLQAVIQLAATQLAVIQLAVMLPAVMLVAATQLAVTLLAVMLQAVMLLAAILLAAMLLAVIQLAVMQLGVMVLVVMCPGAMLMLPEAIQLAVVLQLVQTPAPSAPRQASIVALRTRTSSLPLPTTMRVAVTAIATSTRRHWRSMQAWLLRSSQLALWLPASLWCNVGDATRTPT